MTFTFQTTRVNFLDITKVFFKKNYIINFAFDGWIDQFNNTSSSLQLSEILLSLKL